MSDQPKAKRNIGEIALWIFALIGGLASLIQAYDWLNEATEELTVDVYANEYLTSPEELWVIDDEGVGSFRKSRSGTASSLLRIELTNTGDKTISSVSVRIAGAHTYASTPEYLRTPRILETDKNGWLSVGEIPPDDIKTIYAWSGTRWPSGLKYRTWEDEISVLYNGRKAEISYPQESVIEWLFRKNAFLWPLAILMVLLLISTMQANAADNRKKKSENDDGESSAEKKS